MPESALRYLLVDVFARRPYAGNQLAVVLGGDDLSTAQLQAIACEFNLSETTFPVRRTTEDVAAGADYRVRIFTTTREIPFAGHPTLGTAWVLAHRGELAAGERRQSCLAGLIDVSVPVDLGGTVELGATPRDLSPELSPAACRQLAESVGLTADDITGQVFAAGCGLTWLHLPVTADAIARVRPRLTQMDVAELDDIAMQDPVIGLNVFARDGSAIRSRVLVPGEQVAEDPGTGSAAVGLGVALVAAGHAAADGETRYEIEQGVEIGRPSYLSGRVEAHDGRAVKCWVSGQVHLVAEGTLTPPPG